MASLSLPILAIFGDSNEKYAGFLGNKHLNSSSIYVDSINTAVNEVYI